MKIFVIFLFIFMAALLSCFCLAVVEVALGTVVAYSAAAFFVTLTAVAVVINQIIENKNH